MKVSIRIVLFQKFLILLVSLFLWNGTDLSKHKDPSDCPKNFTCLTTYISLDPLTTSHGLNLDLSFIEGISPKPLDKITLPLDKNGKFMEVLVAKNVSDYRAFWKGKEILISQFDLDISKRLRTLGNKIVQLQSEPNPSASIITIIPKNIVFDVIENTDPLTKNVGYVKVNYNDKIGWVKRTSLSDDEYDIQYYKKSLEELVRPYIFNVKDKYTSIEFRIVGKGFLVTDCKVHENDCTASSRMGEASFGMPEEAVYFDLNVSDEKLYVCEMRRVDFVGELQRMIDETITKEELDPFINCHVSESGTVDDETTEDSFENE
ncbi:SH3 domain-containing protein [Leptospira sp. WS39.C2]